MIHFFNSLAILTVVGVTTFFSGVKSEEEPATTVNTKIQYTLEANSATNINISNKKMQQDKIQLYIDCEDSAL